MGAAGGGIPPLTRQNSRKSFHAVDDYITGSWGRQAFFCQEPLGGSLLHFPKFLIIMGDSKWLDRNNAEQGGGGCV